jgi:hypothetical protein
MARAKRKNITKTADAELFKRHDAFAKSYAREEKLHTPSAIRGSGSKSTKQDQAAHRKWEEAASDAFDMACVVVESSASTLEGMLMKLHVAGFVIRGTKPGTFTGPYRGNNPLWEPGSFAEGEEITIITSLRNDLHRFAGRRV